MSDGEKIGDGDRTVIVGRATIAKLSAGEAVCLENGVSLLPASDLREAPDTWPEIVNVGGVEYERRDTLDALMRLYGPKTQALLNENDLMRSALRGYRRAFKQGTGLQAADDCARIALCDPE